jgi:hypothetical protein
MLGRIVRVAWGASILSFASAMPALAQNDRHCPNLPAATTAFFVGDATMDQEKDRLQNLAGVAKTKDSVCILALVDPAEAAYSRKLAVRRAKWVLDTLTGQGVPRQIIAIEFRPADGGLPKDAARQVDVIVGP